MNNSSSLITMNACLLVESENIEHESIVCMLVCQIAGKYCEEYLLNLSHYFIS